MALNPERNLLDHWLWEAPMLKVFVITAITIPTLSCIILLLTIGYQGFYALVFIGFAPIFGLGYGFVGKKITRLSNAVSPEQGLVIPSMIVRGKIEAAGIIIQKQDSLFFQPIVGKPSTTKLIDISSIREVSCFNGSVLWGKTGFWFVIPDHPRLGCAIPNSYVGEFRMWLAEGVENDA